MWQHRVAEAEKSIAEAEATIERSADAIGGVQVANDILEKGQLELCDLVFKDWWDHPRKELLNLLPMKRPPQRSLQMMRIVSYLAGDPDLRKKAEDDTFVTAEHGETFFKAFKEWLKPRIGRSDSNSDWRAFLETGRPKALSCYFCDILNVVEVWPSTERLTKAREMLLQLEDDGTQDLTRTKRVWGGIYSSALFYRWARVVVNQERIDEAMARPLRSVARSQRELSRQVLRLRRLSEVALMPEEVKVGLQTTHCEGDLAPLRMVM